MAYYDPYSEFNPQVDPSLAGMSQQPRFSWQTQLANGAKSFLGDRDLALALLANSGWQQGPKRGFGEILGQSMLQADQAKQQRADDAFKRQYMQAQINAMGGSRATKPIAVLGPDGKPVLVNEQDAIGKEPYAGGNDAKPSALIQAFNLARTQGFTGSLLEFQRELAKAEAQYPYSVNEVNGVPTLTPRINPTMPVTPQAPGNAQPVLPTKPLSNLTTEADAKRKLAEAGAAGTATGTGTATAAMDFPRIEQNIKQAIGDIDKLKNDPGLQYITGIYSKAPIVPGTPQAAADARALQVEGQTFLQAFNTLKGAGAITEQEGQKATGAIARLKRAQSTEDYKAALDDLKGVLQNGLEVARKKGNAPGAAPRKRYNPATGKIEDAGS